VYHLAAVASGQDARDDLPTAFAITVTGTMHLLEAATRSPHPPLVLITGSSEVYGAPTVDLIDEGTVTRPVSLYGATKLAQEAIGLAFGRVYSLPVIATRSFNHIGPGQREAFAVASFTRQLADIRAGRRPPVLHVGNLTPIRDFTDVRDVVRAYRALVEGRHVGMAVNVASGRGISVGELLEQLIAASGLGVTVEVDAERVRPDDPPRIVGDASLLQHLTGWAPRIPLDETLRDIWQDAVQRWQ
jgi:GDP-4-dehydro-6-deoxy-D-mannose reductase